MAAFVPEQAIVRVVGVLRGVALAVLTLKVTFAP
jgi:hypothetical protein